MKIRVLFFGQLRNSFKEQDFEISSQTTVGDVVQDLGLGEKTSSLRFAINEEFAKLSATLKHQDTLALLPPVSGG